MPDQVITVLSAGDFLSAVSSNLDVMAGIFSRYFSGADNLRIVSIILMLLAFILFLFLIIILFRNGNHRISSIGLKFGNIPPK